MCVRCARGSWLGMTTSGSSGATATATAAACARRRLTRAAVVPSSSSSPSSQAGFPRHHQQQQQQQASAVPQPLFASLATLATAATASPTFAAKSSSSSSHHQSSYHHSLHLHHHHHHQPYHPYPKPSGSSTNNSSHGSGDETEDDERADFQTEFTFPHQQLQYQQQQQQQREPQQHKPQFHPQHHHRLITPNRQTRASISSSHHSNSMPRRKETKKIQIDVPSSEASCGIEGDPHQVFKCNGSPIISPRSIRNSLAETDFDLDGNPRPQKIANTQIPNGTITSKNSITSSPNGSNKSNSHAGMIGPALPPPDVVSPATSTSSNGKEKSSRRRKQQQPQEDADANGSTQNEMDLLALKVEEQSLSGMSGVQLWVHRLLYTHHQTLHVLGLERVDFPNTRLSMKQLECMLSPVISLANMMTPDHFGIHVPTPQVAQTMNDVHYWKLWESDTIDIGIFFMPPNAHIPLHNHPGMSVVTRILYGSVNIRSYDLVSPQELGEDAAEVVSESESTDLVGSDPKVMWARVSREGAYAAESTMWLDPRRFNLHQIHAASDNGCALLDIMIPPYNNADRDCHQFKIVEERYNKDKNERIVKMLESITADNHNEPTESAPPSSSSSSSSQSS